MKKLLICLTALMLTVCTGCAGKGTSEAGTQESAASSVEEGKFDFASTVSNMKICGHDVSLPCAFKDLGEGFEYDSPIESQENNYMFTSLKYNGTDIGTIYLELRSDGKYEESQILSFIFNKKSEAVIKGVTMESSEDELTKALGEDFVKSDSNIDYGSEENGFIRILMESTTNTPMSITVMMPR